MDSFSYVLCLFDRSHVIYWCVSINPLTQFRFCKAWKWPCLLFFFKFYHVILNYIYKKLVISQSPIKIVNLVVLGLLSLYCVCIVDIQTISFLFRKIPIPEFSSWCFDITVIFFSSHIQSVVFLTWPGISFISMVTAL